MTDMRRRTGSQQTGDLKIGGVVKVLGKDVGYAREGDRLFFGSSDLERLLRTTALRHYSKTEPMYTTSGKRMLDAEELAPMIERTRSKQATLVGFYLLGVAAPKLLGRTLKGSPYQGASSVEQLAEEAVRAREAAEKLQEQADQAWTQARYADKIFQQAKQELEDLL